MASAHRALAAGVLQQVLDGAGRSIGIDGERTGQLARRQREDRLGVALDIVALVHQRQAPQCRDDDQKDDDEGRYRSTQERLGCQKPSIGRFGDEARITGKSVASRLSCAKIVPSGAPHASAFAINGTPRISLCCRDPATPHIQIVSKNQR